MTPELRDAYLSESRELVVEYLRGLVSDQSESLSRAMLEYPLRSAKGLRPALCIATCRALGGGLEEAIPTAATLELYHNAFLIHDDVEDGSELRRDRPTLHHEIGSAAAINVGDAMLALALRPLLDNLEVLDLGRALRILEVVARVARETAEGQALELEWIRAGRWDVDETDYVTMVTKKTSWYTFVAPIVCGGLIARAPREWLDEARAFAIELGIAFQIRDDILNLSGHTHEVGKEWCGDLWEGKRTLILSHFFARANDADRARAREILSKLRPAREPLELGDVRAAIDDLHAHGRLSRSAAHEVRLAIEGRIASRYKHADEVAELRSMLDRYDVIAAADRHAREIAGTARARWRELARSTSPGVHRDLVDSLVGYVAERGR